MYIYIMIYVYVCMIMFTDLVRFPQILKYLYIIHIWFPRVDVLVPLCLLVLEALMDKYGDKDLVDDLIARKTEANLFVANPDFPGNQDLNPHVICLMGFKFKIAPQFYKIQFGDHPMAGLEGVLVLGRHGGNRQEFKGQFHHYYIFWCDRWSYCEVFGVLSPMMFDIYCGFGTELGVHVHVFFLEAWSYRCWSTTRTSDRSRWRSSFGNPEAQSQTCSQTWTENPESQDCPTRSDQSS